jgi:response regulator RpfG family c-di-GMP phosphodiesterase
VRKRRVPRVLIADIASAVERLRKALNGDNYELIETPNCDDALAKIKNEHLDLIIVGVHFDESRMFELLGTVKMELKMLDLPFICFRHLHSRWSEATDQGIRMTAELMGACKFIDDAHNLSDEEIRHAVEECISVGQAKAVTD